MLVRAVRAQHTGGAYRGAHRTQGVNTGMALLWEEWEASRGQIWTLLFNQADSRQSSSQQTNNMRPPAYKGYGKVPTKTQHTEKLEPKS